MTPTRLIAFYGYKGCGKSEATKELNEHGFVTHSFAGPLKRMLQALGLTEAQLWGDQKEIPCDLLGGKTPRWSMQSLGTEWGRDLISSDLWTNAWKHSLPEGFVTVDDLRFPNEAVIIKLLGGTIIKVVRPGHDGLTATPGRLAAMMIRLGLYSLRRHESEKYVDDEEALPPDMTIVNDGTLDQFRAKVVLAHSSLQMQTGRTPTS